MRANAAEAHQGTEMEPCTVRNITKYPLILMTLWFIHLRSLVSNRPQILKLISHTQHSAVSQKPHCHNNLTRRFPRALKEQQGGLAEISQPLCRRKNRKFWGKDDKTSGGHGEKRSTFECVERVWVWSWGSSVRYLSVVAAPRGNITSLYEPRRHEIDYETAVKGKPPFSAHIRYLFLSALKVESRRPVLVCRSRATSTATPSARRPSLPFLK